MKVLALMTSLPPIFEQERDFRMCLYSEPAYSVDLIIDDFMPEYPFMIIVLTAPSYATIVSIQGLFLHALYDVRLKICSWTKHQNLSHYLIIIPF
jgi:hypothetical protein